MTTTIDDTTVCSFIDSQNISGLLKATLQEPASASGWKLIAQCLKKVRSSCSEDVADLCEQFLLSSREALVLKEDLEPQQSSGQASAFKEIVWRVFSFKNKVISVSGDGNCFFRSMAQSLFSPSGLELPKAYESEYAQFLREESTKIDKFEDYIETDDKDQKTMSKSGTWASSVQIAKMSYFLQCPIHVLRYDDPGITFDYEKRTITPSPLYVYNEGVEGLPIQLIYEPYPGHYSSISFKPEKAVGYAEAFEKFCTEPTPFNGCQVFLQLESERKEIAGLYKDASKSDSAIRRVIMESLNERKAKVLELIPKFKNTLSEVCNLRDIQETAPKRDVLALKLLKEMLDDDIVFVDGEKEPLALGKGPITKLFQGLKNSNDVPSYAASQTTTARKSPTSTTRSSYPYSSSLSTRPTVIEYSNDEQQHITSPNNEVTYYQGICLPKESLEKEQNSPSKEPPKQVFKKEQPQGTSRTRPAAVEERKTVEDLLKNYNSDTNEWNGVVLGNVIQARRIAVNGDSLGTLLYAINDKTLKGISEIVFYGCELNKDCYDKISAFANRNKRVTFVLSDCSFDASLEKVIEGRKERNITIEDNIRYKINIL